MKAVWSVLDALLLAAAAGVVYCLLAQETLYHVDAQNVVRQLATGSSDHYVHFFFMPVLHGFAALMSSLGLEPYRVAVLASGVGSAVGVFFMHCAARVLGYDRAAALVIAALVATTPAVVFFATIVEFHGVFLAFAGMAWLACAWLVRSPGVVPAILLGVVTCSAGFVHATGQLLGAALPCWFLAERWREPLAVRALAGVACAAHALVFLTLPRLAGVTGTDQMRFWSFYIDHLGPVSGLPVVLWAEWLLPYLPLSVLSLLALRKRAELGRCAALGAALVLYLATCYVLIPHGDERGAYLTPLALPAALLVVRSVAAPVAILAVPVALAVGVFEVERHDDRDTGTAYVQALQEATEGERPVFLVGDLNEVNPLVRHAPEVEFQPFYDWIGLMAKAEDPAPFFANVVTFVRTNRAAGKTVYLAARARDLLTGNRAVPVGEKLWRHLNEHFRIERVARGPFVAYRLVGKPK